MAQEKKARRAYLKHHNLKDIATACKAGEAVMVVPISIVGQSGHKGKSFRALQKLISGIDTKYMIGDSIQRFNLARTSNGEPSSQLAAAKALGQEWLRERGEHLTKAQCLIFSDYLNNRIAQASIATLTQYYADNQIFKDAIDQFTQEYLSRHHTALDASAQQLCVDLALEELGLIAYLIGQVNVEAKTKPTYFMYPSKSFSAFELAMQVFEYKVVWLTLEFKNVKVKTSPNASDESGSSSSDEEKSVNSPDIAKNQANVYNELANCIKTIQKIFNNDPARQIQAMTCVLNLHADMQKSGVGSPTQCSFFNPLHIDAANSLVCDTSIDHSRDNICKF